MISGILGRFYHNSLGLRSFDHFFFLLDLISYLMFEKVKWWLTAN